MMSFLSIRMAKIEKEIDDRLFSVNKSMCFIYRNTHTHIFVYPAGIHIIIVSEKIDKTWLPLKMIPMWQREVFF